MPWCQNSAFIIPLDSLHALSPNTFINQVMFASHFLVLFQAMHYL